MKITELKDLVSQGEGPDLEFKRSTAKLREGMAALCGMLNATGGGRLLFGVSDNGHLTGQDVAEKTLRHVANEARKIEPFVGPEITSVPLPGGRAVLLVEVRSLVEGPFTYDGRPFLRVGNTTQRMSQAEYEGRIEARLEGQVPWERGIAPDWRVRDLDGDEIRRTVEEAIAAGRLRGNPGEGVETILQRLDLVGGRGVTRAAAVLFGKEDGPGYPMGEIRLARFAGTTREEFRDNRQYKGHAFALLRHAERFLEEHIPIASRFVSGRMSREDLPLYPPLAFREGLVNALVHRDYSVDGGAVSLALFDDRLEIWSTGRLPAGLTPEKLKGTHESLPRNRLVADVFYRRGLIERWGRGTNKILSEARKSGCPEPEFEETGASFLVRFQPAVQPEARLVPVELSPRAKEILAILGRSGPLRARGILEALGEGIMLRAVQRDLRLLRKAGRIVTEGRAKATTYRLAEEERH